MIRLMIEEYCHSCLDFTPDVVKPQRAVEASMTDTVVRCEHRKRCENIKRYLERTMVKGESE